MECNTVHQFGSRNNCSVQLHDCMTSAADIRKKNQCRGFVGMFHDCAKGDVGNEAERTLGTDHQMLDDIDRVLVIDKRVDTVSGGVLYLVFARDQLCQGTVRSDLVANILYR